MAGKAKNKWLLLAESIWFLFVLFGGIVIENLFWDSFLKKLQQHNISEEDLMSAAWHVSLPLVVLILGIYGIYFCFKKYLEVGTKEVVQTLERVVDLATESQKKAEIYQLDQLKAEALIQHIQTSERAKSYFPKPKTDRQNYEDYLQRQIDWFEKLIKLARKNGEISTGIFTSQMYWEHQTISGIEVCAGREVAQAVQADFDGYHYRSRINNREMVELDLKLNYLKTLKSNVRTTPHFDIRDLKKFEMETEP